MEGNLSPSLIALEEPVSALADLGASSFFSSSAALSSSSSFSSSLSEVECFPLGSSSSSWIVSVLDFDLVAFEEVVVLAFFEAVASDLGADAPR